MNAPLPLLPPEEPAVKQVLVIEDNPDNLLLITLALERGGYRVVGAATGADGVRLAGELSPCFIVVDTNLPDIDGYEVARRIKGCDGNKGVPVVAITSNALRGDRQRWLQAGCRAYFEKPIDPITIVQHIHAALGI